MLSAMSSLLNNFFVNTFRHILQNALRQPTEEDVNNLHAMIDQVAGQMGINSNSTTNNDTSEQQHSIHCNDGSNINNDNANVSARPALSTTTSNAKQSSSSTSSTPTSAATSSNHQGSNNNTSTSTTAFAMNTVQETPTTKRRRGKRDRDKISTSVEGIVIRFLLW